MANGVQITEGVGKFLATLEKVWAWGTQQQQIVALGDGGSSTNLAIVDANGNLKVTVSGLKAAIKQSRIDVGTAAIQLANPALVGRVSMVLQNDSANIIYVGSSTVTAGGVASGLKIPSGQSLSLDLSDNVAVWAIASAAASGLNILEIA